eukprot:3419206-Pleurochrysis_carterae.AAC.1
MGADVANRSEGVEERCQRGGGVEPVSALEVHDVCLLGVACWHASTVMKTRFGCARVSREPSARRCTSSSKA